MIRRKNAQRSFGYLVHFGSILPEPESLMDPVLRRIDQLLDDETIVEAVVCAQAARKKQSARRGRPSGQASLR